jgi:hypothetical protein
MTKNIFISAIKALTSIDKMQKTLNDNPSISKQFFKRAPSKKKNARQTLIDDIRKKNRAVYLNKKVKNATKIKPYQLFSYNKVSFMNNYEHTFDSKLEFYCYHSLKLNRIPFSFKQSYVLQEKIMNGKKVAVRAITIKPDFELISGNKRLIVDTKGQMTEPSKLRFKMLENKLSKDNINYEVIILKTPAEVANFCRRMLNI